MLALFVYTRNVPIADSKNSLNRTLENIKQMSLKNDELRQVIAELIR